MEFYKYTPALLDPKTLEDTLIGRDVELDNIKRILKSASSGKSFSHPILIGPKGIGKSHLLRIIYYGVRGEIEARGIKAFKNKFVPVILSEEEYPGNITKCFKLVLQYLRDSDARDLPPIPEALMKAVSLNVKEKELALDYIKSFRKKSGKILLVLADNLNDIIERFTREDQSLLREVLMTSDSILLIGAAPTLFDSIINHDKPLYNFFEIIWLKDLSFEDTILLLHRYAELEEKYELLEELKKEEAKLRAIHELAGGNPRLILSLYHIIVEGDITSVENTFLKLLDELSPYFRERMKDLSEQQKEIIDVMARAEGLLTPTEIAGRCYMPVNVVLSQIKRLERAGYIRISKKHARKVFYDFNERLFSLWRQMRVEAGRQRLGFIVKFLELWFTKEELEGQFEKLITEVEKHLTVGNIDMLEALIDKIWYIGEAVPELKTKSSNFVISLSNLSNSIKVLKKLGEKIFTHLHKSLRINSEDQQSFDKLFWSTSFATSLFLNNQLYEAKKVMKSALASIADSADKGTYFGLLSFFFNALIEVQKIDVVKFLLQEFHNNKQLDITKFLSPYLTLIKYLETKDPEIIDRLRHEERIVVEDMMKKVEGNVEEPKKKTRQRKK